MRTKYVFMQRRRVVMEFDLTDAVRIPWDGKTQGTKEEAVIKLWKDQGAPTAGSA